MIAELQPQFPWVAALLGLAVGSFLNVVIHRLPRMLQAQWTAQCAEIEGRPAPQTPRYNLWVPGSQCPSCGHRLHAVHNIPVVSYLALRGRCAFCGSPISARYPVVEALTAALFAWVAVHFGWSEAAAGGLVLTAFLVALAMIDADTTLLPDDLTQPLLWIGLLMNLRSTYAALPDAVIGAVAGYLALWSVYWVFKLVTGKEGMGYGDFKLLAALGAWLGWKMLLPIVLMSSLVGALVGVVLIVLARRGREIPIPFGPYLAAAGFLILLYGDRVAALMGLR
ncbi:MAG TPA: A24 family peptidase [Burkholderiaceae bacterium]|nr:A24 family peptidase [Burkholderiaceae bacterium]